MSVAISMKIHDSGMRMIEQWQTAPARLIAALTDALQRMLVLVEGFIQSDLVSGGDWKTPRGGQTPLASRTGRLLGAINHELHDDGLSGWVGTTDGPTNAYARALLGPDETTIRPVNAKHLWIPIADNLGPGGVMKTSPREAMEKLLPSGVRALSIFRSKAGNLVAFLRDEAGGSYARGKKKGLQRGKLLFVLKDEVVIKGTDALMKSFELKGEEIAAILGDALNSLAPGAGEAA